MNEAAFDLVVNNMRETITNNKKVFAAWHKDLLPADGFAKKLLDAWAIGDPDDQQRLAIAFPQIATAILEYQTLAPKKREKYINKIIGDTAEGIVANITGGTK